MKNVPKLRFKDDNGRAFSAWEEKRLGDFYNFKITNSFSRDNLNYESGKVKNIHYGDIHTKFSTLFDVTKEKVPFINEDVNLDKIKDESYCIEGDVVFADASEDLNDVGKSIEVVNLNGDKLLSGLHTLLARPIGDFFHIGFSGYLFKSDDVRVKIQREAQGSKVLSISATRLVNIKISVPSKPEQEKIAGFLSAVDNRISQLSQKCDGLAQYKKGVMQKIFSQELRFKDEKGRAFPAWEEKEVGDVFRVTRGNVLSMSLVNEKTSDLNKYPVYSSQTKNNGLSGYFNEYLYENSITWTTDGANAGEVNYRNGKFYCTNVCGVLISEYGYANECIAAMINAVSKKYVSYVGNPKLMNGVMAKIPISFPCLEEQAKIAGFVGAVDEKISKAQAQLDALKQYKQGLLQQMFV